MINPTMINPLFPYAYEFYSKSQTLLFRHMLRLFGALLYAGAGAGTCRL